jgi:nitrate reductase delta subunit
MMTNTFKILSALLSYPTVELQKAAGLMRVLLHEEAIIPNSALVELAALIDDLRSADLYDSQERYVFLFDRTRSLSLHLFEHVHGESRDRGQAMVDLQSLYARAGLAIEASELPDYLPMFLEFLSTRPLDEARALLAEPAAVIIALKERLAKRRSPYAAVFHALEAIAAQAPKEGRVEELRKALDDDPNDFVALDAAWADAPVTFGPGESGCPKTSQILDRIRTNGAKSAARS